MRMIVSENWVVGGRSYGSLWLWSFGTYSVLKIIVKTKWKLFDDGWLGVLECGMCEFGWSNVPLSSTLLGMSRPWACHQSLGEGAQVVPAATSDPEKAPDGLVQRTSR